MVNYISGTAQGLDEEGEEGVPEEEGYHEKEDIAGSWPLLREDA